MGVLAAIVFVLIGVAMVTAARWILANPHGYDRFIRGLTRSVPAPPRVRRFMGSSGAAESGAAESGAAESGAKAQGYALGLFGVMLVVGGLRVAVRALTGH
jgi:hypothetical protein